MIDIQNRVLLLLGQVTEQQYRQLGQFGDHRLARLSLHSAEGSDLVNKVVESILTALEEGQSGRHPRLEDLADVPSFLRYLRGAIKSVASLEAKKQNIRGCCESLDDCYQDGDEKPKAPKHEFQAPMSLDQDAELKDLQTVLFQRLRARAPARLSSLIDEWENQFLWTDSIPLNGSHRQYRAALRALAKEVLLGLEVT